VPIEGPSGFLAEMGKSKSNKDGFVRRHFSSQERQPRRAIYHATPIAVKWRNRDRQDVSTRVSENIGIKDVREDGCNLRICPVGLSGLRS
jgi:hypothetical protein